MCLEPPPQRKLDPLWGKGEEDMRIDWRLVHWVAATIGFGAMSLLIFLYVWTVWLGYPIVAYETQPLMFIERYVEPPLLLLPWLITALSIYGHIKMGRRCKFAELLDKVKEAGNA